MKPAYCCIIFNLFPSKIINKNKISTMQIQNRYNSGWKGFQEVSSPTSLLDGKYTSPDHSQIPPLDFPQITTMLFVLNFPKLDIPSCLVYTPTKTAQDAAGLRCQSMLLADTEFAAYKMPLVPFKDTDDDV